VSVRASVPAGGPAPATLPPAMLTVGTLARRHGLARTTLLYYDAIGVLRPAGRSAAGYRRYGPDEERRLELICTYRRAGLPLAAIARVLDGPATALLTALEQRLAELDAEVERLRGQQRLVAALLRRPELLERTRVVDKATWVALLAASGMSEADMWRWHEGFERTNPDKHQRFLELLGLADAEIAAIRADATEGG
jgi:MerR family transcriptional regulator, thiopeptide resistance regulator